MTNQVTGTYTNEVYSKETTAEFKLSNVNVDSQLTDFEDFTWCNKNNYLIQIDWMSDFINDSLQHCSSSYLFSDVMQKNHPGKP